LPFQITGADLKSKKSSGTILFNNELGRLDSSEMNLELEGKLTIMIAGSTTDVDLSQTQKTTGKTTSENPVRKKASPRLDFGSPFGEPQTPGERLTRSPGVCG